MGFVFVDVINQRRPFCLELCTIEAMQILPLVLYIVAGGVTSLVNHSAAVAAAAIVASLCSRGAGRAVHSCCICLQFRAHHVIVTTCSFRSIGWWCLIRRHHLSNITSGMTCGGFCFFNRYCPQWRRTMNTAWWWTWWWSRRWRWEALQRAAGAAEIGDAAAWARLAARWCVNCCRPAGQGLPQRRDDDFSGAGWPHHYYHHPHNQVVTDRLELNTMTKGLRWQERDAYLTSQCVQRAPKYRLLFIIQSPPCDTDFILRGFTFVIHHPCFGSTPNQSFNYI